VLKDKEKRPSYSKAAKVLATRQEQPWTTVQRRKATAAALLNRDKRAVVIDAGRTKAEKNDYAVVKARLQEGLDSVQVTIGLKIECLRLGPRDRIEVVFATKA